jgi:hypothetical protein
MDGSGLHRQGRASARSGVSPQVIDAYLEFTTADPRLSVGIVNAHIRDYISTVTELRAEGRKSPKSS